MIELIPLLFIFLNLIQVFWWLFLISGITVRKKSDCKSNPSVSVVIAAKNEEENLRRYLPFIRSQVYSGDWEVIVILDRPEDDSVALLNKISKDDPRLTFFVQSQSSILPNHSPKKSALIQGIKKSKYDVILQTDADCYPQSDSWIDNMVSSSECGKYFTIGLSPYESEKTFLNQMIQFETSLTTLNMLGLTSKGLAYMSLGRNQLFNKSNFIDSGGYGENSSLLYGDDDLLLQSMTKDKNVNTCVTKDGQTVSIPEESWHSWLKQKLRHSMAGKHYKGKFKLLLALNYLSFPVCLLFFLSFFDSQGYNNLVYLSFLMRIAVLAFVFKSLAKKTGGAIIWWQSILYDLIYSILAFGIGITALLTKKIEWR